jgi:putative heme-binding domain-containing protein
VRVDALKLLLSNDAPQLAATLNELLLDKASPNYVVLQALEMVENKRLAAALPGVRQRLGEKEYATRFRALGALLAIEGEGASAELIEAIKSPALRQAGVAIAGEYQIKSAIPALIEAAADREFQNLVIRSLTQVPDRRALGLYLQGLASKDNTLRDASRQALIAIKSGIGAEIVERHKRNELSPEMRRELQAVFAAPTVIKQWQIVGAWSQDHGEPKFDATKPPDLQAKVTIGAKDIAWKPAKASDDNGRVSPGKYVSPESNVWSLAYAEVEAPLDHEAEFLLGSDDQAVLWINGQRLLQFTGNRGYTPGQDKGKVALKKGLNHIYFLCGNTGGPWDFSLALRMQNPDYAFLFENVPAALDVAVYREHAAKNAGNAEKGKQLFADVKGVGCIKCHAVAGQGAKIGPDLVGIGAKYPREELIRSVLEPSNRVAESYMVTTIVTDAGQVYSGLVQSENETELDLVDAAGKVTKIQKADIEERQKTSVSLMPNGLKDGLTLGDFADVIAYLESLKQAN